MQELIDDLKKVNYRKVFFWILFFGALLSESIPTAILAVGGLHIEYSFLSKK